MATSTLDSARLAPPSRWTRHVKEIACNATLVIAGWSDASAGPLIPYIQGYYAISYTVVSMLFVGQMVGFLSAGFANSHLTERYGLGKVITMGAIIQACGYIFLVPAFPFPIMPCCYCIIGFGMALQDASANVYVSILPNLEQRFGVLHASYGLGAMVCPLAATAFASSGIRFSYFYIISISLALLNIAILLAAFKFDYRIDDETHVSAATADEIEMDVKGEEAEAQIAQPKKQRGKLQQTLSSKLVWLFSIFTLVYVGAEVSTGGWIVTFLVDERSGGPSAGYVATGFWGGITLGRALLPALNVRVGEKRIVFYYLAIAFALEFSIWFANNLVANAVVVSLIGFIIGPLYPIMISLATQHIPRPLHSSAIGFIAAFGQSGSAIFPFLTGALAQRYSTIALQPVMVALFATLAGIWWFVPPPTRKQE